MQAHKVVLVVCCAMASAACQRHQCTALSARQYQCRACSSPACARILWPYASGMLLHMRPGDILHGALYNGEAFPESTTRGDASCRPFVRACLFQPGERQRLDSLVRNASADADRMSALQRAAPVELATHAASSGSWDRCEAHPPRLLCIHWARHPLGLEAGSIDLSLCCLSKQHLHHYYCDSFTCLVACQPVGSLRSFPCVRAASLVDPMLQVPGSCGGGLAELQGDLGGPAPAVHCQAPGGAGAAAAPGGAPGEAAACGVCEACNELRDI